MIINTLKTILLLLILSSSVSGQSNSELAVQKKDLALKLFDEGKLKESILLLQEATELDSQKIDYPYFLAVIKYTIKDYKGSIDVLEKLISHPQLNARVFHLLGVAYDAIGESQKSFDNYKRGLKKFPASGILYMEMGNSNFKKQNYDNAIKLYEKGIEVDPNFSGNYQKAAAMFFNSPQKVWGILYGEIFMNLERNSNNTVAMSADLYNMYKNSINVKDGAPKSVSFCKNVQISTGSKLPFCTVYELLMLTSIVKENNLDINSLSRIRTAFLDTYISKDYQKTYQNVIFDYQQRVKSAGHLDAYNHWLLSKGDKDKSNAWQAAHKEEWGSFMQWFNNNGLKLGPAYRFYRTQYE